jgi:hypothetical protein
VTEVMVKRVATASPVEAAARKRAAANANGSPSCQDVAVSATAVGRAPWPEEGCPEHQGPGLLGQPE